MGKQIKWGIIGLGKIAKKFAEDLHLTENSVLQAVASKNSERAKEFASTYNSLHYFGSYQKLADYPDIDIVYIATPHTSHYECTMMCLRQGKSVLCEKPMGMSSQQVKIMIEEARSRNLFLMEGVWTRFIPVINSLVEMLDQNVIGELNYLRADFGFKAPYDPERRIYNKTLGGGSLMDVGLYPVYLSLLCLGEPTEINALARWSETGVDSSCFMIFDYPNSAKAVLESSIDMDTPTEAYIYGTKGYIKIFRSFHHSEKITVFVDGEPPKEIEIAYLGNGYVHEIQEINNCLLIGNSESSKLPLTMSLNLSTLLEKIRSVIGLNYEGYRFN